MNNVDDFISFYLFTAYEEVDTNDDVDTKLFPTRNNANCCLWNLFYFEVQMILRTGSDAASHGQAEIRG